MAKILIEKRDGVATITLNRPEQGNAIDMDLASELAAAATDCAGDGSVRCVVLTGAGRMFCVGGDIAAFAGAGEEAGPFLHRLADKLHEGVMTLATMGKPLVTAINGPAAGAGMSLAILGDFALASEASHFTAAYTAIGLTPDGGMSWLLPRLVGVRMAQSMILTNRRVTALEAVEAGLVSRAVEAGSLMAEAAELSAQLSSGAMTAVGAARVLMLEGASRPLQAHLDAEAAAIAAAAGSSDGREGVSAFLDRRKPAFDRL